jgi:hypothetical protein
MVKLYITFLNPKKAVIILCVTGVLNLPSILGCGTLHEYKFCLIKV